ncbi:MAG: FIST C-terminal domain-containing protein [Planctomycetes bacterium]|nr:FIST C-terminal domain-containing protein [Planctomycetota bacterium]
MSLTTTMRFASFMSDLGELEPALEDARRHFGPQLGGTRPDLLVVYASPHFEPLYDRLAARLQEAFGPRHMLGGSAAGLIGGMREVEHQPGLALAAAWLPGVELTPYHWPNEALPDQDAGPRAWHAALNLAPERKPHFILHCDPFSARVEDLLRGLDFAYPAAVKVGGLVSGARQAGRNALFLDGRAYREGTTGLAVSGGVRIDPLVAQGCRPIGVPVRVTKCRQNVLQELDGKKPLEIVAELFQESPERDRELIRSALFMGLIMDPYRAPPWHAGDFLIRNVIGMDPQAGALIVGAFLREGQVVQFHVRDAQAAEHELLQLLRGYATALLSEGKGEALGAPPAGALLFSCLGRGKHMYGRPNHDSDAFRACLGDVPLAGFFCNGEIGPVGGTTYIHGFTSSFAIFRPAAPA